MEIQLSMYTRTYELINLKIMTCISLSFPFLYFLIAIKQELNHQFKVPNLKSKPIQKNEEIVKKLAEIIS